MLFSFFVLFVCFVLLVCLFFVGFFFFFFFCGWRYINIYQTPMNSEVPYYYFNDIAFIQGQSCMRSEDVRIYCAHLLENSLESFFDVIWYAVAKCLWVEAHYSSSLLECIHLQ